jgi:hypothetical protein
MAAFEFRAATDVFVAPVYSPCFFIMAISRLHYVRVSGSIGLYFPTTLYCSDVGSTVVARECRHWAEKGEKVSGTSVQSAPSSAAHALALSRPSSTARPPAPPTLLPHGCPLVILLHTILNCASVTPLFIQSGHFLGRASGTHTTGQIRESRHYSSTPAPLVRQGPPVLDSATRSDRPSEGTRSFRQETI